MNTILTRRDLEPLSYGDLVFRCSRLEDVRELCSDMFKAHSDEISSHGRVADVDWDALQRVEDAGLLSIYTANTSGGEIVGYIGYFISMSLHYKSTKQAVSHALYLKPEYRKGMNAMMFIRYSELDLAERGVGYVNQAVTTRNDYSRLVKRMGYTEGETIYTKRLGDQNG